MQTLTAKDAKYGFGRLIDLARAEPVAVAYVPPDSPFHIDILTRLGEAFRFEDLETMETEFKGAPVPVVTPRMLYRMKRDTVRPKDRGAAEELRRRFGFGERD